MKRIAICAGIVLLLAFFGIFLIHGEEPRDTSHEPVKVGMLMIGSREESSWNEAHWAGMLAAAHELNLSLDCRENVSINDCSAIMDKLIKDGCRVIISTFITFEGQVVEMAKAHPQVYFFQATGTRTRANLATYMGRMYQMRYLAGIVAGSRTKTHAVGYVATEAIPEVIRGIDAFALGVRKADPTAKIYVKYTHVWSDVNRDRAATNELLDAVPAIDVIGMHLDSYGALEMADARGVYTIGCNTDQRSRFPNTFLAAPIWNWSIFYTKYVREALNNKFEGRDYLVGAETGIVSLAQVYGEKRPETDRLIASERSRLMDGECDVFYGPIWDQKGVLRVAEGESLSDKTLFQTLDWYVEGVVLP